MTKIPAKRKPAHAESLKLLSEERAASEGGAPGNGESAAPRALICNAKGAPRINTLVCGDCIEVLNNGPEGWADLVFADPPFNIGYLYHNYNDKLGTKEYVEFSRRWMKAVHRALKPHGSFFLAIGDEYAADLCVVARRELGFCMRNWIVWHYTFGQQTKAKFAKSHTHILYFTKDEKQFTFNADAVRVASARQTTYADARANPKGKLPDDTWYLRPQETSKEYFPPGSDTWYVSRVCGTFKEREGWHGCQMPIGVLNRVILASSNPGDVVLDPFNGSGTTTVAAALLKRKYVGIDQSEEYVGFARKRLDHALAVTANHAADNTEDAVSLAVAVANDPNRRSRLFTGTDALGRARVDNERSPFRAAPQLPKCSGKTPDSRDSEA